MSKKKNEKNANWQKAYRQAARWGITLTKRKDSQGNYVCFLSKNSRNLLACL